MSLSVIKSSQLTSNMQKNNKRVLPLALKIVAIIFILGGITTLIEVIVSLLNKRIDINFGVLGIFIGIGLFKLSQGWRICALVWTWFVLITVPIIGFMFLGHPNPLDFSIFGQKVGVVSKQVGVAMAALLFVYTLWQYRVLTREDVRRLFIAK